MAQISVTVTVTIDLDQDGNPATQQDAEAAAQVIREALGEEFSDRISDKTGWCVNGWGVQGQVDLPGEEGEGDESDSEEGEDESTFGFIVAETVVLERLYTVSADSAEQAREMAERGDTASEKTLRTQGVISREVLEDI